MKFDALNEKDEELSVDVYREGNATKTRIRYPKPKRTEREYSEYDDENEDREDL